MWQHSSFSFPLHVFQSAEGRIEEKTQEIKDRDALIAAREKMIKENSHNMASLESEIASLKVSDCKGFVMEI